MNTHTLYFCPLIRKLQAFEILKWAQESQWRKQRTSNFTREIQLIFYCSENTAFYIFTAVKYSFFKICIIFNTYFPVFHYFVYNKCSYRIVCPPVRGDTCTIVGIATFMNRINFVLSWVELEKVVLPRGPDTACLKSLKSALIKIRV